MTRNVQMVKHTPLIFYITNIRSMASLWRRKHEIKHGLWPQSEPYPLHSALQNPVGCKTNVVQAAAENCSSRDSHCYLSVVVPFGLGPVAYNILSVSLKDLPGGIISPYLRELFNGVHRVPQRFP